MAEKTKEESVKLVVGTSEFKLDDKFFGECLMKLDEDDGGTSKHEYAKIGLKRYSDLLVENQNLKSEVKELNKEIYDANTREIVLRGELDTFRSNHGVPLPSPIPHDQYNALKKKLEGIGKEQEKTNPIIHKIEKTTSENKINIDRAYGIMGSRNQKKNLFCKLKLFRDLDYSTHSVTFFGTESALQGVQSMVGEIQRDVKILLRKKKISFELTEKTGLDNLVQLATDNDKEHKEGSVAVIILNFAAETADCLLEDDKMGNMYVSSANIHIPKMCSILKSKYDVVRIVVPPSTPKSLKMIKKVATVLENIGHGEKIEIINMTKLQIAFGDLNDEEEKVWKLDGGEKMFKKFSVIEGKAEEGWNQFSTNVMISKVVQVTLGVNDELCQECGVDHGTPGSCIEMGKSQDDVLENKFKGGSSFSGQESEECLKCFRAHSTADCRVSGVLKCSFIGCNRRGHQWIVHCPKKQETISRLREQYDHNFIVSTKDTRKHVMNYSGSSNSSKT